MPWAGSARCVRPCLGPEADRRRGAPDPRHGPARLSPRLRRLLRRRRPGRPPGAASGTAVPPPHRRVSLCGRCASPCGRWVRASVSRHTAATPPPHRRDAALPRHRRIRRPGGGAPLRGRVVPPLAASRRSLVATARRWPWRPWGRQGAAGRLVRTPWTAFVLRDAPPPMPRPRRARGAGPRTATPPSDLPPAPRALRLAPWRRPSRAPDAMDQRVQGHRATPPFAPQRAPSSRLPTWRDSALRAMEPSPPRGATPPFAPRRRHRAASAAPHPVRLQRGGTCPRTRPSHRRLALVGSRPPLPAVLGACRRFPLGRSFVGWDDTTRGRGLPPAGAGTQGRGRW